MNSKFFHPVSTFSNTGKTAKGRALQKIAMQFDRVLIHGENSAIKLTLRLREMAAAIDARYPRTRPTFVECHVDNDGCGQITASPVSEDRPCLDQDYFRIIFNSVAHSATIEEVIDGLTIDTAGKGGES